MHYCKKCNDKHFLYPEDLIKNKTCPLNKKRVHYNKDSFPKKIKEVNSDIELNGEFINSSTKTTFKCLKCNNIWEAMPSKIMHSNHGCPICSKEKRRKSNICRAGEKYNEYARSNGFEILDEYNGCNIPLRIKCLNCGTITYKRPSSLIKDVIYGCKTCADNSLKLTNEEFLESIKYLNITPLTKYDNSNTRIKYRCNICGEIHDAFASNLKKGFGCPTCSMSKGEKKCIEIFKLHNINYIPQYSFDDLLGVGGSKLRFDFAIFINGRIKLIEYDGLFHYKKLYDSDNFDILKIHDSRKDEYYANNNIQLLRIPYWEFDNIEKFINDFINE